MDPEYRYLVISVTDPKSDPANIRKRWGLLDPERDILRLQFSDVDVGRWVADGWTPEQEDERTYVPMSRFHAAQILPFLGARLREGVEHIVIHCEAGLSRSPSLAMAITDVLGLDRKLIDWPLGDVHELPPNVHVYEQLCEVSFEQLGIWSE